MDRNSIQERYRQVRFATAALCRALRTEDYVVQSMPDASPVKWHLAHTTWFFETFVLARASAAYQLFDRSYDQLFNSYYYSLGSPHPRPQRGLITRPTTEEVWGYREAIDARLDSFFSDASGEQFAEVAFAIELGLNHEEQHQELILTDLKHLFSLNPLKPSYAAPGPTPGSREGDPRVEFAPEGWDSTRDPGSPSSWLTFVRAGRAPAPPESRENSEWLDFEGGVLSIGARDNRPDADRGFDRRAFAFDNERPRHRVFLEPYSIARQLVTCGQYLDFMRDGGYLRNELWLSDGWAAVQAHGWRAPLYWEEREGEWRLFTLRGMRPVDPAEPVCHISQYEADAYARWAGARLPTEAEWEVAAEAAGRSSTLLESGAFHPRALAVATKGKVSAKGIDSVRGPTTNTPSDTAVLEQAFGEVWEWTASAYLPYPGFKPFADGLGEYNGKFMSGQMVLRGASCVTPRRHVRMSYRNFFAPDARWQFGGVRLGK